MPDRSKPLTFRFVEKDKEWKFVPQCPICSQELGERTLGDHLQENQDCVPGVVHEE